ncbi:MAG TPA: GntR family transcriptional regulator [Methylococcaceae bacterium]|nr:GntR family transcriptional regulator [Methylococcaceae bacterium]
MITIGKTNTLHVSKQNSSGIYLSDKGSGKHVLLVDERPKKYELDEMLRVFVFVDGEGHLCATTRIPWAQVNEIAYLRVVSVNYYGAFLDWGMQKNLLLPYSEQHHELDVGDFYFVKLLLDEKERLIASTKLTAHVSDEMQQNEFTVGQKVNLLITDQTPLGIKAIVNHTHWGVLYENEVFETLQRGQRIEGLIKHIREDLRLDLALHEAGYGKVAPLTERILTMLHENGGAMTVSDKSPPETIYALFGVSKKVFKQAIGALYKQKQIVIEPTRIRLA